ncbi:MAG: hypothetical protein RQ833_06840 [Sphingomonadaceae bacterium]|nr:hypothetical protein [Sphingomonadaceae bacterium]
MENQPVSGGVDQSRIATFHRLITMFKWIIIVGMIVLAGLWAFTK